MRNQAYRNQWTGPLPIIDRFWANVEKTETCWLWLGKMINKGYGVMAVEGRYLLAHRLAWTIVVGEAIPDGLLVLHTCDVRRCVRNDEFGTYDIAGQSYVRYGHLFLGTYAANTADMVAKGRYGFLVHPETRPTGNRNRSITHPESVPRGEACANAKVTAADVAAIRRRYASGGIRHIDLAKEYGLALSQIGRIIRGESWGSP